MSLNLLGQGDSTEVNFNYEEIIFIVHSHNKNRFDHKKSYSGAARNFKAENFDNFDTNQQSVILQCT